MHLKPCIYKFQTKSVDGYEIVRDVFSSLTHFILLIRYCH